MQNDWCGGGYMTYLYMGKKMRLSWDSPVEEAHQYPGSDPAHGAACSLQNDSPSTGHPLYCQRQMSHVNITACHVRLDLRRYSKHAILIQ